MLELPILGLHLVFTGSDNLRKEPVYCALVILAGDYISYFGFRTVTYKAEAFLGFVVSIKKHLEKKERNI